MARLVNNWKQLLIGFVIGTWILATYNGHGQGPVLKTHDLGYGTGKKMARPFRRPPPLPAFLDEAGGFRDLNSIKESSTSTTLMKDVPTSRTSKSSSTSVTSASSSPSAFSFSSTKKILFFTSFFHMKDFGFGFGHDAFVEHKCPVHNCLTTSNRSLLSSVADFDAVVFHMRDMDKMQTVVPNQKKRKKKQVYVMFLVESPQHDGFPYHKMKSELAEFFFFKYILLFSSFSDFFNWTMTYRLDSDIPRPYGFILPKDVTLKRMSDLREYAGKWKPFHMQEFKKSLAKKSKSFHDLSKRPKSVGWIVSNCNTESRREDYVRTLREHVDVEVMGGCGATKCDVGNNDLGDNCTTAIERDFKFYLSFENSLCNSYVTEKFWRRMDSNVIPIVMGMANYTHLAPPHSYIDVADFPDPKDLSKYLKKLMSDPVEYLSYFWWKDHYKVYKGIQNKSFAFCELCEKLHDPKLNHKSYPDMEEWWVKGGKCKTKEDVPWAGADQGWLLKEMSSVASRLLGRPKI